MDETEMACKKGERRAVGDIYIIIFLVVRGDAVQVNCKITGGGLIDEC